MALQLNVLTPDSFGLGAVLSNQDAIQQQAFTSASHDPIVASVVLDANSVLARLDGLQSDTLTFTYALTLTDLFGSGATADTVNTLYVALSLQIGATAGEVGPVTLQITNELSYASGIASAFFMVGDRVSRAYTGGDPDILIPPPYPRSDVITLPLNVGDTFNLNVTLFGDPKLAHVEANFTSTLVVSADTQGPSRRQAVKGHDALAAPGIIGR